MSGSQAKSRLRFTRPWGGRGWELHPLHGDVLASGTHNRSGPGYLKYVLYFPHFSRSWSLCLVKSFQRSFLSVWEEGPQGRYLSPAWAKEERRHKPNTWAHILRIPTHFTFGPSLMKIPLRELIVKSRSLNPWGSESSPVSFWVNLPHRDGSPNT